MKTDVRLSTRFLTTQNAHQVGMLVTLEGETPVRRAPINVALVLDRSGSMHGMPLEAAKEAAARFASFLTPQDRLSAVTFDSTVQTIFGPGAGGSVSAIDAIARVECGGSTNLSGGWLVGLRLVKKERMEGVNRVVLLTDGQANVGIVETDKLVGLARDGAGRQVTTTCIGFGPGFNEDLLEPMAQAGGGNYWYVESDDQMAGIFEGEIEGLVALAAQNVEIEVRLTHPSVAGVSLLQSYQVQQTPEDGWRIALHDLYATSPKALGLLFHVEDVAQLGRVQLGEVRVEADIVTAEGIEHRTTTLPVFANLDGEDHVEPMVEQTFLRFQAARAREEAVRRADNGDFAGAASSLRDAAAGFMDCLESPGMVEEMEDLQAEAVRLEQRKYEASDRKYQGARAMAAREMKADYARRVSRRQRQKEE
jgi:Ca-activated chloride channel family protein